MRERERESGRQTDSLKDSINFTIQDQLQDYGRYLRANGAVNFPPRLTRRRRLLGELSDPVVTCSLPDVVLNFPPR